MVPPLKKYWKIRLSYSEFSRFRRVIFSPGFATLRVAFKISASRKCRFLKKRLSPRGLTKYPVCCLPGGRKRPAGSRLELPLGLVRFFKKLRASSTCCCD